MNIASMSLTTKQQLYEFWKQSRTVTNENALSAFLQVSREQFVQPNARKLAYQDHPLPVGYGQTISQPTTVMLMIELLEVEEGHKVLEIGAGSGYNAAILSKLANFVYTLEYIPELAAFAQNNIHDAGIVNVQVIQQDGKQGYEKAAPYKRIIVTAAASVVPEKLLGQLAEDGIMVVPVGKPYGCEMLKIHRSGDEFKTSRHGMFSFVPLV
ncbi:MAG: protein-L-isoaspartate(D-aspartate) O-methyltransferase [SAR324 cluster bacterium]|nr:protein-L-isoaspartate(D-aspartate) O-methyltransferase [SAR324 cluster bacterium]